MNYATSIPWYIDSLTLTKLFVKMLKFSKKYFFREENFVRENKEFSSGIFFFSTC
jgi:hypothetical protein